MPLTKVDAVAWETQLRKGLLEFVILLVLARGESYGYEIVRHVNEDVGMDVGEGTVYPILRRLEQDGTLSAEWREREAGVPRKYYGLTASGRRTVDAMRRAWRDTVGVIGQLDRRGRA